MIGRLTSNKSSDSGFTLIELMIVLAIVSILAAVAFPSYKDSINRSRRSDGLIAVEKAAAMQEQHYFQANQYATDINDIGGVNGVLTSPEQHYLITTSSTTPTLDFTVTATAQSTGAKADEECYFIRISNTGLRTAHKKSDSGFTTNQSNCFRN